MGLGRDWNSAALTYLNQRAIEVHVLETREVVKLYNELADGRR